MPIAKTASVDILLIVSIAVSISISAIVVSNIVSSQTVSMYSMNVDSNLSPAQSEEQAKDDTDTRKLAGSREGMYGGGGSLSAPLAEDGLPGSGSGYTPQSNLASGFTPFYESAQYILPISWGAVVGTLIWRGKVRSSWSSQGYDYETFRLVVRTRGSPIRVKLLNRVATAKNRLQLANELEVDWKTVDNHMEILTRSGLVEEMAMVGTARYYILTEHGRRILLLLADGQGERTAVARPEAAGALGTLNAVG